MSTGPVGNDTSAPHPGSAHIGAATLLTHPGLNVAERNQLRTLRRVGTAGAVLMAVAATSSYGAANPIPNPVDGLRIVGLLSRIGPASLAISYTGIAMVVVSWFLLGRLATPGRQRRLTRTQISHTLAMWAVPFLVSPPLFSRDVYSYLAVGQMMNAGLNPYDAGPYDALGDQDRFAHQVDVRWQHTTTPYGPVFLLITRGIVAVTGPHLVLSVLVQRLFELLGVALIVWALPRLARRCGLDPVSALWLGALNPLVLFHLIAGGHNEALMIGLMMAGLVIAFDHSVVLGTICLTLAVGVKATAGLALAFLIIALARRAGGTWRDLIKEGLRVSAVAIATFAVLTIAAGVGVGWLAALNTPGLVRSFLSLTTVLGVAAGTMGTLLGVGDHTGGVLSVLNPIGTVIGGCIALLVLWRCWRHRLEPIHGLGVAIGIFVLLSPVVQPWYLLWAAVPLAASTADPRYRKVTVAITVVLSLIIMPSGAIISPLVIVQAVAFAALVQGLIYLRLRRLGLLPVSDRDRRLTDLLLRARKLHPSTSGTGN
ncbi:DUF2029 domain-containing protein [Nakamurella antarctica]|uniref:DUF2029 domain-containing protein n=1 Tax=Nakamurella antarctica TaxID=1902245 RepID=A0A3G8ZWJ1_9ACTN|nr:polyprenol phosphomannose-dependent alpha 1,6 mannosyltransferase MptB [Nakamurella antarctica]AZI58061.1 DUF2029 domain-containing protein [Nakamurella antarctica]